MGLGDTDLLDLYVIPTSMEVNCLSISVSLGFALDQGASDFNGHVNCLGNL